MKRQSRTTRAFFTNSAVPGALSHPFTGAGIIPENTKLISLSAAATNADPLRFRMKRKDERRGTMDADRFILVVDVECAWEEACLDYS